MGGDPLDKFHSPSLLGDKNMTQNLISTPNITGNIGSCKAEATKVVTSRTLWIENTQTIVVNSCTGQIQTFNSWQLSGESFFVCAVSAILFVFIIGTFFIFSK